ncbi:MAG: phage portal protein [Kiritimatiellae bacterium]|nr:phage portal protein [Kiritimatiellia bacterium]
MRDIVSFARQRLWQTFGPMVGAGAATTIGDVLGSDINSGANAPTSNIVMVYACVRARRDAIGGVEFRAERPGRDGATTVENGPLVDLLERPNRDMLWGEYVRTIETHLTLYDVAAIYVDADGRKPIALVPLHPAGLTVEHGIYAPSGTPTVGAWRYSDPVTGEQRRFEREQVVIHRGYNPDAPLAALTAVTPLRRTILNDNGIREANLALLKNGSVPSFMLSAPGLSTREQARELQQAWQEQNSGIKKRHGVSVTWGQAKAEKLGLTPQEMEFLAGLSALRQDYYRVFRVAPAMTFDLIGETGLSQGSATDEQIRMWWEMVGTGEIQVIEGLHNEIFARWPAITAGARFVADSSSLPVFVRARQAKVKDVQSLVNLGWKPDDASEYLDLDLPAHADNIARVPFNMQAIGETSEAETTASAAIAGGAAEGIQDKALNGAQVASLNAIVQSVASGMLPGEAAVLMIVGAFPTIPEADAKAMIAAAVAFEPETPAPAQSAPGNGGAPRGALAALAALERAIGGRANAKRQALDVLRAALTKNEAKRWSRFWVEQRGRVLEAAKRLPAREAHAETRRRGDEAEQILGKIFDATAENAALAARLAPLWQQEFQAGWDFANQELAVKAADNPFQISDPRIKTALDRWTVHGQLANDTTSEALRKILQESFDEGLTNAELGDKIADYYANNCVGEKSARPQTAARTQVNGIVNESRLMAADEIGGLLKVWNHGSPDEPRPDHVAAAQTYAAGIPLDQKFKLGAYECDAPGAATLPADEVCNCTCFVTFVKQGS